MIRAAEFNAKACRNLFVGREYHCWLLSFDSNSLKDCLTFSIAIVCGLPVLGQKLAPPSSRRGLFNQVVDPLDKELRVGRTRSYRLGIYDDENCAGMTLVAVLPVHPPSGEPLALAEVHRGLKHHRGARSHCGGL